MPLSDYKVLTFDCYGTLIDWETGMVAALRPIADKASRPLTRNDILEAHAAHEAFQERQTPTKLYRDLLSIVFKRLAEQWGVAVTHEECVAYGRSIADWPAFPDSPAALQYLKRFYKLVILSNVDNESFAASNKRLQVQFDAVITAEDVGFYKPDPRNFDYLLHRLGAMDLAKPDILHTAQSLFHDHKPANAIDLASCWIDRRHLQEGLGATSDPGGTPHWNYRFTTMGEMADAHRAEQTG